MWSLRQTRVFMDTAVTVELVDESAGEEGDAAAERAFARFAQVESVCSRFDPDSELRRLSARPGEAVEVSAVLFEAVRFALAVARASGGAFDPTVGGPMEQRGFDRNYRTGLAERGGAAAAPGASWRDVHLQARRHRITLRRPLLLDLGAVAKGLAADLALRELAGFAGCAIDAGGDVAVRGRNGSGTPWRIGIRHPRRPDTLCTSLCLGDGAVCTSGDYERRAPGPDGGSHLLDPRDGAPAADVASCTVVAPNAMMADALGTAACVLGPGFAVSWLERQGVEAVLYSPAMERFATSGFARLEQCP